MARKYVDNTYTDEAGKFAEGNPGKPKGARHKALSEENSEYLKRCGFAWFDPKKP